MARSSPFRPAWWLFFAAVSLVWAQPGLRTLREVRYSSFGDYTRVIVELSEVAEPTEQRIDNPDRVFFDLPNTVPHLASGKKGAQILPVGDRFLKQIRMGENQPGLTRLVFDLSEGGIEHRWTRMENPARLVVEFYRRGESPKRIAPPSEGVARKAPARKLDVAKLMAPRPLKPRPVVWLQGPYPVAPSRALPNLPSNYGLLPLAPPPPEIKVVAASKLPQDDPLPSKAEPALLPAEPAKTNASGDRSLIRALGLKVGRIVIDPGHGGTDFGTTGPSGLKEKDLVLDLAKRLGSLLEERLGSEVIYTRTDDSHVPLEDRARIANERKADLFISIHANSSPAREAVGVETFYLNFAASGTAMEVAARENMTARKNVGELHQLVEKIALNTKVKESQEFAAKVQAALVQYSERGRDRGVKRAPFVVLIGAAMPSILTEVGFLSNPREEAQLKKSEYRQRVAEALYQGVAGYAKSLSHFSQAAGGGNARTGTARFATRTEEEYD